MTLPAAAVADALVRLGHPVRLAPASVRRAFPGGPIAGAAVPVRLFGSVDVFLEAYESAPKGGALVIDNQGCDDEACIGDLTVAEAKLAGIAGIVLWGCEVEVVAARIVADESRQADLIARGTSLRRQLGFAEYLERRGADPSYTLRQHLLERGGAIET